MTKYEVKHRDDGVSTGAWEKDSVFEYAVFGTGPIFGYGKLMALFFEKEHADHFASSLNLNVAVWQVIAELNHAKNF